MREITEGSAAHVDGPRGPAGFSLLEVMVAVAVLVGGLMGLGMAMISAYRLDRATTERKIALAFAASQIERIRGMTWRDVNLRPRLNNAVPPDVAGSGGYLCDPAWGTTSSGTSAAVGTAAGAGSVGFRYTLDGDTDEDYFGLYFTRQTWNSAGWYSPVVVTMASGWQITTSDALLNSLNPIPRYGGRMAQVSFQDPDGSTGVTEGSGYWVSVRVFWQGSSGGEQEERLHTFVAR